MLEALQTLLLTAGTGTVVVLLFRRLVKPTLPSAEQEDEDDLWKDYW